MSNISQRVRPRRRLLVVAPVAVVAALTLASCSNAESASDDPPGVGTTVPETFEASPNPTPMAAAGSTADAGLADESPVLATIKDTSGKDVGRAQFIGSGDSVTVSVDVDGLTPGLHSLAVTSAGVCEASDDFASAGEVRTDSADNTEGLPKAGDLPTLLVDADGIGKLTTTSSSLDIESLGDEPGAALVIGADADSSSRIACGVIEVQ